MKANASTTPTSTSIKSANPSQSNPLTPTPFSISKPFPLSDLSSLKSTASSSTRTPMDSASPKPRTLLIPPRTNRRSAKRKGRKKKKEEGDLWNVLEFGGMVGEKKEGKKVWGQKVLEASAHSISSPKPTPWRKKCPRTNEGSPDCENVLPRTTLSSAGQNHNRGRRHVARDNPLEDRKRDSKPYRLGIRAW